MANLSDWVRLKCWPNIGAKRAGLLLAHFGNPAPALAANATQLQKAGVPASAAKNRNDIDELLVEHTLQWLDQPNHALVTPDHPHASAMLAQLGGAPVGLYALGDTELLTRPAIAIVGSRNPTPAGREHAYDFAAFLARSGFVIVSGLANGIDTAAHEGALSVNGMTIAACATGLDRVYPAKNKQLAQRIAEQGLLVSEYNLGTQPARGHFPQRNRIIAGHSAGTLVVEAARASGSLITARMAMEAGREVLAIPGAVNNPLARGCHQLIRQGAKLVETAQDVFEEIMPALPDTASAFTAALPPAVDADNTAAETADADAENQHILDALGYSPTRIDELVERTGWSAQALSSRLLILELSGQVTSQPGGRYMRADNGNSKA